MSPLEDSVLFIGVHFFSSEFLSRLLIPQRVNRIGVGCTPGLSAYGDKHNPQCQRNRMTGPLSLVLSALVSESGDSKYDCRCYEYPQRPI